jgi:hypothetical protein
MNQPNVNRESKVDMQPIQRIENPSPAQLDQCIRAHRPVIFSGLMRGQTATTSWDVPFLKQRLGTRPVKVVSHDKPKLFWDPERGLPIRSQPFAEFAARFDGKPTDYSYLQDDINNLPALRGDYVLPRMMEEKGLLRGKFWLSGEGLITPLHYDPVETFHWVIRGSKRFVSYQPGVRRFYPFPAKSTAPFISQVDPDHPDPARCPRFAAATPFEFTVRAGEILYLPAFWWHQVYSQDGANVSLNFVWFASRAKCYRHFLQYARARAHIRKTVATVKAQAEATRAELAKVQAHGLRAPTTNSVMAP